MRFRIEQRFAHPVETVEDALFDPNFLTLMAELPRLGRPQLISRDENGDTLRLKVRYAFVGDLSAAVRAVVDPDQLTWVQDETADRLTHRSRFTILPDHYANLLRCSGTFRLDDDGHGGSVRVADGEIRVSVPLLGGKVERAIVSGLEEHAREEARLVDKWAVQDHPSS